jgi:hypothetical protein
MKSGIFRTIILFLFFLTSANVSVAQTGSSRVKTSKDSRKDVIQLFNGKDLGDWVFMLKDPSVDPSKVFTVQNGLIHITGAPFGYMRTKKSYSEYKLHAEWRWPAEATNSGIFIHAQLPDTIWLRCFECQLAAGNAGDFICANGSDMNERIDKTKKSVKKMNPSNEKAVGEWNTMEVICKANTIEVFVNGVLQNKATGASASEGFICLQSEGKDIEFRNLILTKLKN